MDTNGQSLASEVVQVCQAMYQKGFIASSEGNVSVRLGPGRLLVTPSGVHKGFLRPEQLVITDFDGTRISGDFAPDAGGTGPGSVVTTVRRRDGSTLSGAGSSPTDEVGDEAGW